MARPLRRPTGPRRGQLPGLALVALAAALSAAVAGCATAPSGGPPRAAQGGNGQVQAYVQPLPPPGPTSKWSAADVVNGFLHASASYAFDPAAARQYLAPALQKAWHPNQVAVVGGATQLTSVANQSKQIGPGGGEKTVTFTGQSLATLSQSGQYQYKPGGSAQYTFQLAKTNNVWLIQLIKPRLPQTLVLTESDFEHVYEPRNLFFYAAHPAGELIPDPVYAPTESSNSALNTDLATGLVNGLLHRPADGWLKGVTNSAFPPGTRLLRKVLITGKTAHVDLGGTAAHAGASRVQQMAEQLQATLSDGAYAPPLASNVELSINNRPRTVASGSGFVRTVPVGPVEFVTGHGSVSQLPAVPTARTKPQVRLTAAQIGSAVVTAVAATPDIDGAQQVAVAVKAGAGCSVTVWSGSQAAPRIQLPGSTGPCTSLSYDANGNLWAAAGLGVWVVQPNHAPVAVSLSAMSSAVGKGDQILALRMAPDAVRAALLVATPSGKRLLLAAVHYGDGAALGQPVTVGAGGPVTDPLAISWYDPYHLAVLVTAGVYEVPLTTGAGQPAPAQVASAPPSGAAETLTTTITDNGPEFIVGTSQGSLYAEVSSSGWSFVANGADPVYPG